MFKGDIFKNLLKVYSEVEKKKRGGTGQDTC